MKIVGRVGLRVWPDLDGFRALLLSGLKKATAGVTVKIPVVVDDRLLAESVRAAVRKMNAQAKADPRMKVKVDADADTDKLGENIRNAANSAGDSAKIKLDVDDDAFAANLKRSMDVALRDVASDQSLKLRVTDLVASDSWASEWRRLWSAFYADLPRELGSGDGLIPIGFDREHWRQEFTDFRQMARKEIERGFDGTVIKGEVEPELDEPAAASVRSRLAALFAKIRAGIQAALDSAAAAKVKAALSGMFSKFRANITPEMDMANLAAMKARIAEIEQMLRDMDRNIDIKIEMDREAALKAKAEIHALRDEISKKEKLLLDVDLEKGAAAKIRNEIKALRIQAQQLGNDMTLDVAISADSVAKTRAQMKALKLEMDDLKVKVDLDEASLLKAEAEANARFGKIVAKVKVVLDKVSLAKTRTALEALSGWRAAKMFIDPAPLKNLDTQIVKITALTLGIAHAASAVGVLAGNVFTIGQDMARIAPLALALPGAFMSAAASAMVLLSVMKTHSKEIKAGLKQIEAQIDAGFWEKAEAPLRSMAKVLMPEMLAGFKILSGSMGTFFGAFGTSLKNALGGGVMTSFFAGAGGFFDALTPKADNLANIIKNLGTLGAKYFPQLGKWVGDIAEGFDKWLDNAVKTGKAHDWIERAKQNLKDFGNATKGAYRVMSELSSIAREAGSSTLSDLGIGLNGIADALQQVEVRQRAVGLLAAMRQALEGASLASGDNVKKFITNWVDGLTMMLPLAGTIFGQLASKLADVFGNPQLISQIDTFLRNLSANFGLLDGVFAGMKVSLVAIVSLADVVLQNILLIANAMTSGMEDTAAKLGKALETVVKNLGGGLAKFIEGVKPGMTELINALLPRIESLSKSIGTTLEKIAPDVKTITTNIATLIKDHGDEIDTFFDEMLTDVGKVITGVADISTGVVQLSQGDFAGAGKSISTGLIAGIVDGFWDSLTAGIKSLFPSDFWANAMPEGGLVDVFIKNTQEEFAKITSEGWFANEGAKIWNDLVAGFKAGMLATPVGTSILAAFQAVIDAVKDLFGIHSPSTVFFQIAVDCIQGFINGLLSMPGLLLEAIATVFGGVATAVVTKLSELLPQVSAIWTGITIATQTAWEAIKAAVTGKSAEASTAGVARFRELSAGVSTESENARAAGVSKFEALKLGIAMAVTSIKNGVAAGFKAMGASMAPPIQTGADQVMGIITGLKGQIQSAFDGINLYASGQSMMQSLASGITQGGIAAAAAAVTAMAGVRAAMPNSPAKVGPFSGKGWTLYSGRAISKSIADGILDEIGTAKKASLALASAVRSPLDELPSQSSLVAATAAAGVGTQAAPTGGDVYTFNLSVDVNDIKQVTDLVDFADTLRRRHRATTGR